MTYYYEMTRRGVGKGSAVYLIGQKQAAAASEIRAAVNAQSRLEAEADMVPCPKCHWVSTDLIKGYRRGKYRGIMPYIIAAFFGFILMGVIAISQLTEKMGYASKLPMVVGQILMLLGLLSPAWIPLGRVILRQRINPNRNHPDKPRLPAGTPEALVMVNDPKAGESMLVPATGNRA